MIQQQLHTDDPADFEEVRGGENFQLFADRVGVHPDRLAQMNMAYLQEHARSRGFDSANFLRSVPDPDGGAIHDGSGQRVRLMPDYHVFAGQRLRIREVE